MSHNHTHSMLPSCTECCNTSELPACDFPTCHKSSMLLHLYVMQENIQQRSLGVLSLMHAALAHLVLPVLSSRFLPLPVGVTLKNCNEMSLGLAPPGPSASTNCKPGSQAASKPAAAAVNQLVARMPGCIVPCSTVARQVLTT